jgi:hypothetical protein
MMVRTRGKKTKSLVALPEDESKIEGFGIPVRKRTEKDEEAVMRKLRRCISGEQVTTTSIIGASQDIIIGVLPDITVVPKIGGTADLGEEFQKHLLEYYESQGMSFQAGEPVCKGGLVSIGQTCLQEMIDAFCKTADEGPKKKQDKQLKAKVVLDKREAPHSALHLTSLQQRQSKVNATTCGSQYYTFRWSGADGDCNVSCKEATGALSISTVRETRFIWLSSYLLQALVGAAK